MRERREKQEEEKEISPGSAAGSGRRVALAVVPMRQFFTVIRPYRSSPLRVKCLFPATMVFTIVTGLLLLSPLKTPRALSPTKLSVMVQLTIVTGPPSQR